MTTRPTRPLDVGASLEPPAIPRLTRYTHEDRHRIDAALRAGEIVRLRAGVFGAPVSGLSPGLRVRAHVLQHVAAAAERIETDFWFSHETAAVLWGLWTWHLAEKVHLTQLGNPSVQRTREPKVVRHWTGLPARDRAVVNGLPVTSLERTAVDCARTLRPGPALVAVDAALRKRANPQVITQILEESRGKRGVVQARDVVGHATPHSESPGESVVRWAALDAGLRPPTTAIPVVTDRGRFWVDLGWEDLKIGIEFDGEEKYSGKYGDPADVRRRERLRQEALEREGWIIIRFRWEDFEDLDTVVEALRAAIRRRRATTQPR